MKFQHYLGRNEQVDFTLKFEFTFSRKHQDSLHILEKLHESLTLL